MDLCLRLSYDIISHIIKSFTYLYNCNDYEICKYVMTMLYISMKLAPCTDFCVEFFSKFHKILWNCDVTTLTSDIGSIEKKINTCQTQFYTNSSGTDRLMKALKKNQHFVLAQKNSTAIAMRSFACWYDIFEQQLSSLYTTAFKVLQKVVYA